MYNSLLLIKNLLSNSNEGSSKNLRVVQEKINTLFLLILEDLKKIKLCFYNLY